jgi:glycosyltransferase involved in cell wall biosynthesis
MACGLPVVSFDCLWGPHEIITNGENGLLVENGNIIKMADAINILIRNKKYREQIGKKSVVSVQQYNRSQIVQKWNDLFKKIIET